MIAEQISWNDRIRYSLALERESDAFFRTAADDTDPFYTLRGDVEALHREIACRLIRALPEEDVSSVGRNALVRASFINGAALPQDCIRIVAATIQRLPGDIPFYPARGPVSVEEWYQMSPLDERHQLAFAIVGGALRFKGETLNVTYLREPELIEFQYDGSVLPPAAYNQMCFDWVHLQLAVADWLMPGAM